MPLPISYREPDEDDRREAIRERRLLRRRTRCVCGDDLPGHCPGPESCPYSGYNDDEEPTE